MSEQDSRTRMVLKALYANWDALNALSPGLEMSLTQLAGVIEGNEGSLSKAAPTLEEIGLIKSKIVDPDRGKPRKMIKITKLGELLLASINDILNSSYSAEGAPETKLVERYVGLLAAGDMKVRRIAADQIQLESTRHVFPVDSQFHVFMKDHLLDADYGEVMWTLISSLRNTLRSSGEKEKIEILKLHGEALRRLSVGAVSDDRGARVRYEATETLSELLPPTAAYDFLKKAYLSHVVEHSIFAGSFRQLLQSRYPGRQGEIKLALLDLLEGASDDLCERVSVELSQLT